MLTAEQIMNQANGLGASHAAPVDVTFIKTDQGLRNMCAMNTCGNYGKNWGCPPGCGEMEELNKKMAVYKNGVVYQLVGTLEDSFDFEGMIKHAKTFSDITLGLKEAFDTDSTMILGAGGCSICEECTYPDNPCPFPEKTNVSVEACGIQVSELCAAAKLNYINGENTVTYTGLVLF